MKKNILIAAEVYSENLGDGAIFLSLSDSIKKHFPDSNIDKLDLSGLHSWKEEQKVSYTSEEEKRQGKGKLSQFFKRSQILKTLYYTYLWYGKSRPKCIDAWDKKVKQSDIVIIGGGQLLTSNNLYFPLRIYDIYRLCQRYNKPLAIVGCGVGKEWGIIAQHCYKKVINYAQYISVRDEVSKDRIKNFIQVNSFHHSDPGFSIVQGLTLDEQVTVQHSRTKKPELFINLQPVGDFQYFVPELKNFSEQEYINFWINIIHECKEKYRISLITNGHPKDFATISHLYKRLQAQGLEDICLIPRATRPEELIKQINMCDFIISTRMHAGIIAYSLGKGVIPISWDDKVNNVWKEVSGDDVTVMPPSILKTGLKLFTIENAFSESQLRQKEHIEKSIINLNTSIKNFLNDVF